ncbi:MAG: hypothetical protein ACLQRH_16560 [Acidimicrobiales bacterium]
MPLTASEQGFYDCGDLSQADAAAGNTTPSCESSPGNGLPEAPDAFALPVLALGAFTALFTIRRRRAGPTVSVLENP